MRLPYASSRTVHGIPTQRSGRVLLARIPLGPPPSLHPLRERLTAFPRRFRFPLARLQRFRLRARLGPPWLRSPASSALCSGTSSVLLGSQTPCSVHRCRAPVGFTSRPTLPRGRPQGLPVLAHSASTHAQGLRPRQAPAHLALSVRRVLPSALERASAPGTSTRFRGSIPGLRVPGQRFGHVLSDVST